MLRATARHSKAKLWGSPRCPASTSLPDGCEHFQLIKLALLGRERERERERDRPLPVK